MLPMFVACHVNFCSLTLSQLFVEVLVLLVYDHLTLLSILYCLNYLGIQLPENKDTTSVWGLSLSTWSLLLTHHLKCRGLRMSVV